MDLVHRSRVSLVLAVLVAAGLAYDAKVHLHLASSYDPVGSSITQGGLFRVEAGLAIAAAVLVLVSDSRLAWAAAGLVGLGGLVAVVVYRYYDVGAIGPLPDMYEPIWFGQKTHSAYAEGAVAVLWLVREGLRVGAGRSRDARTASAVSAAG